MDAKDAPIVQQTQKPLDQIRNRDEIIEQLRAMIGEAEEAASYEIAMYNKNMAYLKGQHFLTQGPKGDWITDQSNPYWRLRLKRDIIGPVQSTTLPILHKLRPRIVIEADFPGEDVYAYHDGRHIPLGVDGATAAGQLQRVLEAEWERRQEEILQAETLIDVQVGGTAFRYYVPITDAMGVTRIYPKLLARHEFLGDPNGTDLSTFADFKYIVIEQMMDVADIERYYGVKERDFARHKDGDSFEGADSGLYRRSYSWVQGQAGEMVRTTSMRRRRYPVHTIFYNQGTPDVISYGKKPPKSLNFPLGRQMVLINRCYLAADRHNPYWHGKFPITAYQTMPMPHCAAGFSDIGPLTDIQNMVNILQNMVLTNALVLGVPQWIAEKGVIDAGDITNKPGEVMWVQPGTMARGAFKQVEHRTMTSEIYNILRDLQHFGMEDLGDASDALQGKSLGAGASGAYANTLLGAALTKQGFRARMLDCAHRRSAWIETSMMQQFMYVDENFIRRNKDLGEYLHMNLAMRELFFDAKVESQADMPHNPQARLNLAANMFSLGIFDPKEFMLYTGMKVRPELEKMLYEASKFFYPAMPAEMQAQIRFQLEVAALQLRQKQTAIGNAGGGQQTALPSQATNRSGEEMSGVGATQGTGVAGNPDARVL